MCVDVRMYVLTVYVLYTRMYVCICVWIDALIVTCMYILNVWEFRCPVTYNVYCGIAYMYNGRTTLHIWWSNHVHMLGECCVTCTVYHILQYVCGHRCAIIHTRTYWSSSIRLFSSTVNSSLRSDSHPHTC